MQFKTPQRKTKSNLNIIINNNTINKTTNQKFLGLIIDENLSWKKHCDYVIESLNAYCYLVRNLKSDYLFMTENIF